MTSSRLPGKVLLPLAGKPALERMVERVKKANTVSQVVVATTTNKQDDPIVSLCQEIDCDYFRGSEDDVLQRVLDAAKKNHGDILVELTGDCPLNDPALIDQMVHYYLEHNVDYVYNRLHPGLPDGLDVQVFSVQNLEKISLLTKDPIDRVHVSCFFYNNPNLFKLSDYKIEPGHPLYWPKLAITLDEKDDYHLISKIFDQLYPTNNDFSAQDIIQYLKAHPELLNLNKHIKRKDISEG